MSLLVLSGCVRYDVGVDVQGQHRGVITQHVRLGEPLTNFSQGEVSQWLRTLEARAKKLHGKTKRISDAEVIISIPFANGQELRDRFNQFFDPTGQSATSPEASDDLVALAAGLELQQSNLLLVERDRLSLDVDLRGLGNLGDRQDIIFNAKEVLALEFALNTPWGATIPEQSLPAQRQQIHQTTWKLIPGQINHLEAIFWLPSSLGIGAIVIAVFVAGGATIRQRLNP